MSARGINEGNRGRQDELAIGDKGGIILGFQTNEGTMAASELTEQVHDCIVSGRDSKAPKLNTGESVPGLRGHVIETKWTVRGEIVKWGEPGEKSDGKREDVVREIKTRGSRDNGTRVNLLTSIQTDACKL